MKGYCPFRCRRFDKIDGDAVLAGDRSRAELRGPGPVRVHAGPRAERSSPDKVEDRRTVAWIDEDTPVLRRTAPSMSWSTMPTARGPRSHRGRRAPVRRGHGFTFHSAQALHRTVELSARRTASGCGRLGFPLRAAAYRCPGPTHGGSRLDEPTRKPWGCRYAGSGTTAMRIDIGFPFSIVASGQCMEDTPVRRSGR